MKLHSKQKEFEYLYTYLFFSMLQVKAGSAHMNCSVTQIWMEIIMENHVVHI